MLSEIVKEGLKKCLYLEPVEVFCVALRSYRDAPLFLREHGLSLDGQPALFSGENSSLIKESWHFWVQSNFRYRAEFVILELWGANISGGKKMALSVEQQKFGSNTTCEQNQTRFGSV